MKETLKGIGTLLGISFVGLVLLVGWAMYGPVVKNFIFPKRLYYTVTADLSVNGQHVRMSGTVECRWEQHAVAPLVTDTSHYVMTGGPVAKRLQDGSALVLWIGGRCSERDDAFGVLFDQNPRVKIANASGVVFANATTHWYLLHLDDAAKPNHVTAYLGPEYFQNSTTDIHLYRVETRKETSGRVTDFSAEVPWLRTDGSTHRSDSAIFLGYYARVVPRDMWAKDENLEKFFSRFKRPTDNAYVELNEAGLQKTSRKLSSTGYLAPLIEDGNRLSLVTDRPDQNWSFTLAPAENASAIDVPCNWTFFPGLMPKSRWQLSIDGRPFPGEIIDSSRMLFDPASKLLIDIGMLCLSPNWRVGP